MSLPVALRASLRRLGRLRRRLLL
ncbi:MAG: hypothetical protein JWR42_2178, partial [Marmoricola sp.]|nr:hypothetical protein [Marmoricola sp.]